MPHALQSNSTYLNSFMFYPTDPQEVVKVVLILIIKAPQGLMIFLLLLCAWRICIGMWITFYCIVFYLVIPFHYKVQIIRFILRLFVNCFILFSECTDCVLNIEKVGAFQTIQATRVAKREGTKNCVAFPLFLLYVHYFMVCIIYLHIYMFYNNCYTPLLIVEHISVYAFIELLQSIYICSEF